MKNKIRITSVPNLSNVKYTAQTPSGGLNTRPSWASSGTMGNGEKEENENVHTTIGPVDRDQATVEAEEGEVVVSPDQKDGIAKSYKIGGKPHSKGGTPLALKGGEFIYSQTPKFKKITGDVAKYFGLNPKKKYTPADVAKKFPLNDHAAVITNGRENDKLKKRTHALMYGNNLAMLQKLAVWQEAQKGFPTGMPNIANIPQQQSEEVGESNQATESEQNEKTAKFGIYNVPKAQPGIWNPYDFQAMMDANKNAHTSFPINYNAATGNDVVGQNTLQSLKRDNAVTQFPNSAWTATKSPALGEYVAQNKQYDYFDQGPANSQGEAIAVGKDNKTSNKEVPTPGKVSNTYAYKARKRGLLPSDYGEMINQLAYYKGAPPSEANIPTMAIPELQVPSVRGADQSLDAALNAAMAYNNMFGDAKQARLANLEALGKVGEQKATLHGEAENQSKALINEYNWKKAAQRYDEDMKRALARKQYQDELQMYGQQLSNAQRTGIAGALQALNQARKRNSNLGMMEYTNFVGTPYYYDKFGNIQYDPAIAQQLKNVYKTQTSDVSSSVPQVDYSSQAFKDAFNKAAAAAYIQQQNARKYGNSKMMYGNQGMYGVPGYNPYGNMGIYGYDPYGTYDENNATGG